MIAPGPRSDASPSGPGGAWREARRWVASMFFSDGARSERIIPVATWKAWAFAAWAVMVTLIYLVRMAGLVP